MDETSRRETRARVLDDQIIAAIYDEHAPALRRFVTRATSDPSGAEDVVQETILKAWKQAPTITTSMRAYLFRTARNLVIDGYRRAERRPKEVDAEVALATTPDVERIDSLLDRLLVEDALDRLQPDHRAIVVALYYQRLTVKEAALALGIPEGTVKSRAFYAVSSLRSIFDETGVTR
jgi:RNA polymerase sigma-70 factor, ECF subfamily